MALYGAPLPYSDSALRAIITALEMMEALKKWNRERTLENLPEVNAGIGIHTGLVVAGNMGAETRLNYTVLGANVNLASRLCAHAEAMQILITEATLNELHVRESIIVEELPPMQFKGFSEPVKTYAVKGLRPHA
jgi:adenylate cyclase